MRICPFNGCDKRLPDLKFACWPHWNGMTVADKHEVNAAYLAYTASEIGLDELRARQQAVLGDRGDARKGERCST